MLGLYNFVRNIQPTDFQVGWGVVFGLNLKEMDIKAPFSCTSKQPRVLFTGIHRMNSHERVGMIQKFV